METIYDAQAPIAATKAIEVRVIGHKIISLGNDSTGENVIIVGVRRDEGCDIPFGHMHVLRISQNVGHKFDGQMRINT